MILKQQRQEAIKIARRQARQMNIDPDSITASDALAILDDVARVEPDLIASRWYLAATDNQVRLFRREWGQHFSFSQYE